MKLTCKQCGSPYHSKMSCKDNPVAVAKAAATKKRMQLKAASKPKKPRAASKIKKVKAPTQKKKATKTALKKKLEVLVKTYVKQRDGYICQRCQKKVEGVNCHASHVIPVSRSGYLQFEPLNMKALCYHCHLNWWHKHPIEAGRWFTDTFPDRWEYLDNLHKQRLKPYNEAELQEKIDYYRGKITK